MCVCNYCIIIIIIIIIIITWRLLKYLFQIIDIFLLLVLCDLFYIGMGTRNRQARSCLCCHSGKCVRCSCVLSGKNCHNCLPSRNNSCSNTSRAAILILQPRGPHLLGFTCLQTYKNSSRIATYYLLPSGHPLCC